VGALVGSVLRQKESSLLYYAVKVLLSALVIVVVSELAKRQPTFAALVASLPLISLLAFVWLYLEGSPVGEIGALSRDIFWLVLPSLVLFVLLPVLFHVGLGFWLSLGLSVGATVASYGLMLWLLERFRDG
jgi:hypothetical protein